MFNYIVSQFKRLNKTDSYYIKITDGEGNKVVRITTSLAQLAVEKLENSKPVKDS